MALLYGQLVVVQELEEGEQRRASRRVRRMLRDTQDPFSVPAVEFTRQFRLHKEACRHVIASLEPHMAGGHYASRIPVTLRILAALNFFATGSYQKSVGNNLLACLSQPMVSRSIREVSTVIARHLVRQWIRYPRNNAERLLLQQRFQVRHQMPHIVGVVDGTHVAIVTPSENEHVYVNRKGYHSINSQLICDADLRITNIVARWPGSTHDAYIWRRSRIGQALRANYENGDHSSRIMGDSGYACLPWLLVPLPQPRTLQERRFNTRFKRTRSLVERCIGNLKGRFRCLLKDRTLHYSPRMAAQIIVSCAVLHNIALHFHVEQPEPMWDELDQELADPRQPPEPDVVYRQLGQQQRNNYIRQYF